MSHNYKIKVDEKELPPERIDSHKNFGKVLTQYQSLTQPIYKRPLYKNPRTFAGIVLIASIAGLVWLAMKEEEAAKKTATADSLAVPQEHIVYAPAFSPPLVMPLALEVKSGADTRVQGIRGTFDFPQLSSPLTIIDYRSANDLLATGMHSLDARDNGIGVEKIIHVTGSVDRPISFTWEQIREKEEYMVLHRWDSEAHAWVPAQAPQRELLKTVVNGPENSSGDDGFKAIEFGKDPAESRDVKSHSTQGETREQEKYTWTITLPGTYRMARQFEVMGIVPSANIAPVDAKGKALKLQRMFLVYEDGNIQNMEAAADGKWNCVRTSKAFAAYGFTAAGELVYAPASALKADGTAQLFTPWVGTPDSPQTLLRALFGAPK